MENELDRLDKFSVQTPLKSVLTDGINKYVLLNVFEDLDLITIEPIAFELPPLIPDNEEEIQATLDEYYSGDKWRKGHGNKRSITIYDASSMKVLFAYKWVK